MITDSIIKKISTLDGDSKYRVNYQVLKNWNLEHSDQEVKWTLLPIEPSELDSLNLKYDVFQEETILLELEGKILLTDKTIYTLDKKIPLYLVVDIEINQIGFQHGSIFIFKNWRFPYEGRYADYIIKYDSEKKFSLEKFVDLLLSISKTESDSSISDYINHYGKEFCLKTLVEKYKPYYHSCCRIVNYYRYIKNNKLALKYIEDYPRDNTYLNLIKAQILWEEGELTKARNLALYLKNTATSGDTGWNGENLLESVNELFERYNKYFIEHFNELRIEDKKFILPVEDYKVDSSFKKEDLKRNKMVTVVKRNELPIEQFPQSGISLNMVYLCIPGGNGYIEITDDYESKFIDSKLIEFEQFVQYLGAYKIYISKNEFNSLEESSSTTESQKAGAKGLGGEVTGSHKSDTDKYKKQEAAKSATKVMTFKSPVKQPEKAENLFWFNREKEWQHLYEARVDRNIDTYDMELSSYAESIVNTKEQESIEAEIKGWGVNLSVKSQIEQRYKKTEKKAQHLFIRVEFANTENNINFDEKMDRLTKLKTLLDSGALTEDEFNKLKADILHN